MFQSRVMKNDNTYVGNCQGENGPQNATQIRVTDTRAYRNVLQTF